MNGKNIFIEGDQISSDYYFESGNIYTDFVNNYGIGKYPDLSWHEDLVNIIDGCAFE